MAIGAICAVAAFGFANPAAADGIIVTKAPWLNDPGYNWTGWYVGAHIGGAFGTSNWSSGASGSAPIYQTINTWDESGGFIAGIQGGYNYLLPNRVLIGGEADFTFPNFPSTLGLSTGPSVNFTAPGIGAMNFSEALLSSGTLRGRIGYAPGHWLFYATGGFAWAYSQQTLTNLTTGAVEAPFVWRLGWAAGAGLETPIAPHWTAKLEYLFIDFGNKTYQFTGGAQPFTSNLPLQEVRAGVNYRFSTDASPPTLMMSAVPPEDNVNFHGQGTFVWQGTAPFRSPPGSTGANSLQPVANGRETIDATLYAGLRLWQGAEMWVDPEIDQGHGLAETHGAAGFPSGESYKLGFSYPYGRVQRYFVKQTIDLGGETEKVEADVHQFAGSQTANRLVLWVGKFSVADIFDTNKYANNPKVDFLNWSLINAGTFDYAGDAWGYSYGAAAEWYQGIFALRAGVFDMSAVPAEASSALVDPITADAYGLDEGFNQQQFLAEIEERHALWGQPGKLKVTAFVTHGRMGNFQDAVATAAAAAPGTALSDVNNAIVADRTYRLRPGVSLNLEQQVNDWMGFFARVGWADGKVEPWDFTDIDRTVSAGVSIAGKQWGRPDDTIGIAGVVNALDPAHRAYFAAGGLGILVGDGSLTNYGLEQIIEAYYSYAITPLLKVGVDYQLIVNPAYNADRGPVNVFAGRIHTTF